MLKSHLNLKKKDIKGSVPWSPLVWLKLEKSKRNQILSNTLGGGKSAKWCSRYICVS